MTSSNEILLANLAISYDRNKHSLLATFQNDQELLSWYKIFKKIKPANWLAKQDLPAIALSSLIDSYYLLPERPDMAFSFLWSGINSLYNDFYIPKIASKDKVVKDSAGIEYAAGLIASVLDDEIKLNVKKAGRAKITIRELIIEYVSQAEQRNLNHAASIYLKGYAITAHNKSCAPSDCIREVLISQSYKSASKKFKRVHDHVCNSAGPKYSANCKIIETADKTDYDIQVIDRNISREITHAIGGEIKLIAASGSAAKWFSDDKTWILFLIQTFLYSSRNSAIHGNSTSRINSTHFDKDHVKSAIWTYKFGYCIFSILLYLRKDAHLDDLGILYANIASPL